MYTLQTFYHCKQWEKLIKQLRMERLNGQGEIICEYCGKPIVKAYDLIAHHREELTEQNVNDVTISLNPDNISFVHHRCHNFIHNKLGYKCREVFLVYGAPLSGKLEWVKSNMNEGDLIIDIDSIWECVSGCERYVKPNRLKSVVFKARDGLFETVRYRLGKWCNAYIIGGYALSSERERLCKELGAREVFIESTEAECLARLDALQIPEKSEWERYIKQWFALYTPPTDPDC